MGAPMDKDEFIKSQEIEFDDDAHPSKLDEIDKLICSFMSPVIIGKPTQKHKDALYSNPDFISTKQAINQYISEIIGEDEPLPFGEEYTDTAYVTGRNNLKAEQRKKANL